MDKRQKKAFIYLRKFFLTIKNGILKFFVNVWSKIKEIIVFGFSFIIIVVIYYIFTGIFYNHFTTGQIEDFIIKELPNNNYRTKIYSYDLKGYGEKSLIIFTEARDNDLKKSYFSQRDMDKIFIFEKINKNPLEALIFQGDIFKKSFSFEFSIRCYGEEGAKYDNTCFKNTAQEYFEGDPYENGALEYWIYKQLPHISSNIKEVKFGERSQLLINSYIFNGSVNPMTQYYFILKYDLLSGYTIEPLIEDNNKNSEENKKAREEGMLINEKEKAIINGETKDINITSFMEGFLYNYLEFKDDQNFLFYGVDKSKLTESDNPPKDDKYFFSIEKYTFDKHTNIFIPTDSEFPKVIKKSYNELNLNY